MRLPKHLLILGLIILSCSCKNSNKYPYAVKDFRDSLQPHLTNIVTRALVTHQDSALRHMATDEELRKLSLSEHPLLRASAFREMLRRTTFDNFDILMNHLDDTSVVMVDNGHYGISVETVSDDILAHAEWKTPEALNKTIDAVVTKHNYLEAAYSVLLRLEPQEKNYPAVKAMATRNLDNDNKRLDLGFGETQYALYGLAKFKKREDVQVIKGDLGTNVWRLSHISLQLMEHFPDTAYMEILEQYHRRQFYRYAGYDRDGFTTSAPYTAEPEDFIKALVAQQNERSAILLDTMLNRLPKHTNMPGRKYAEEQLILAIWESPGLVYTKLKKKIKSQAQIILAGRISLRLDDDEYPMASADADYGGERWPN